MTFLIVFGNCGFNHSLSLPKQEEIKRRGKYFFSVFEEHVRNMRDDLNNEKKKKTFVRAKAMYMHTTVHVRTYMVPILFLLF